MIINISDEEALEILEDLFKDDEKSRAINNLIEIARYELKVYGKIQDDDWFTMQLEKIIFADNVEYRQ